MRTTIQDAHRAIARRADFDAGNMRGIAGGNLQWHYGGRLSDEWSARLWLDEPTYVVYSYGTPIFWVARDGREVLPPVRYSVSTARHQQQCVRTMSWNPWRQLREPAPYELKEVA